MISNTQSTKEENENLDKIKNLHALKTTIRNTKDKSQTERKYLQYIRLTKKLVVLPATQEDENPIFKK